VFRRAAVLCLFALTAIRADDASWLGRQVMLRESGLELETTVAGQKAGEVSLNTWEILTVLREKDGRVWVRNREAEGWLDKKSVVLVEDAAEWFTREIERSPKDESAFAHRARAHHFLGDYDKAIADFSEGLKLSPSAAWIWNNRAIVWADMKEFNKSIEDYTKALQLNPSYYLPLSNRGLIWLRKKKYDEALADFAAAIKHNPQYSFAFSNRALLWIEKRNFDEALKDCDQALRLNPGATSVRAVRGLLFLTMKRHDEALRELNTAIELEPRNATAHAYRARTRAKLGDSALARKDFEEAIRQRPMIDWFYRDYAGFLATCKDAPHRDGAKALELLAKAVERKIEQDGRYLSVVAAVQAELGKFDEAVKRQEEALKDPHLQPDEIAEYKSRLGRYQKREAWRE
jgi:tetratricopeptide (TPR) repeat protein